MSSKWRTAFKEIHGRTPNKQDYAFAPDHVKKELGHEEENDQTITEDETATVKRRTGVRLKRPADDEFSPYKPLAKRMALDQAAASPSTPSRGQSSTSTRVLFGTPSRNVQTTPSRLLPTSSRTLATSVSKTPTIRAPQLRSSPRKTPLRLSVFDTPEKGQPSPLPSLVPTFSQNIKTPIKSPQKPCRRVLKITNTDSLLAPTPEKRPPPEEPAFEAVEVPTTSTTTKARKSTGGEAKIFDPTTGKVIKRPFKSGGAAAPKAKKAGKEKGNFVSINLRKKAFTRGKVSAESKRKLARKMKWKKRFGGAK